jgi:cytochrome c-type protein NapC
VQTALESTADADYCGSCHSLEPMVLSYRDNSHGGANEFGVAAECVDCHLPHDNPVAHLTAKIRTGVHDVWVEWTTDTSQIDWLAKSDEREHFVYDSGCLSCHSELRSVADRVEEHRNYFAGVTDSKCTTCHGNIGHSNIRQYMLQHKYGQ